MTGGLKWKSTLIASNMFLEEGLLSVCDREGTGLDSGVAYLEIDVWNRTMRLEKKERSRRQNCMKRICFPKKTKEEFGTAHMRQGASTNSKDESGSRKSVRNQCGCHVAVTKRTFEETRSKHTTYRLKHESVCAAANFWAQAVWTNQWSRETWNKRGACRAGKPRRGGKPQDLEEFFKDMQDLGITLPCWKVLLNMCGINLGGQICKHNLLEKIGWGECD